MKMFRVPVLLLISAIAAIAQTNAPQFEAVPSALPAEDSPGAAQLREALRNTETPAQPANTTPSIASTPSATSVAAAPTTAAQPAMDAGTTSALPTHAISLQDCIQQALEHNLDLQIERYNPEMSLYSLRSSYGSYDPTLNFSGQHDYSETGGSGFDPTTGLPRLGSTTKRDSFDSSLGGLLPWGLNYELFGNTSESYGKNVGTNAFDNSRGQIGVNLTQPLLKNFWIDNTRLSIRTAKNRLKYSDEGLRLKVMNIVTDVENSYYDLIAARENVKVREKALELANRLLAENKKRVEVGALAPLDEKQAESQVATARADLLTSRQIFASQQNVLKSLLTDNYSNLHDAELEPTETLSAPLQFFNLQDSWSKGINQRPDLKQAKLDLEQQGIQLKYDRNQLFPQVDAFGSYGYNAGSPNTVEFSDALREIRDRDMAFYTYGGRISIPLSLQAERNNYKKTKLSVRQALLSVKRIEQQILVGIDDAITTAKVSHERVDATRAAREYAEAALDAEQKKLQSGKSTSFIVLQLQRDLTDARSQEIAALADYNKALAALAFQEGSTLDRRNLDVEVK